MFSWKSIKDLLIFVGILFGLILFIALINGCKNKGNEKLKISMDSYFGMTEMDINWENYSKFKQFDESKLELDRSTERPINLKNLVAGDIDVCLMYRVTDYKILNEVKDKVVILRDERNDFFPTYSKALVVRKSKLKEIPELSVFINSISSLELTEKYLDALLECSKFEEQNDAKGAAEVYINSLLPELKSRNYSTKETNIKLSTGTQDVFGRECYAIKILLNTLGYEVTWNGDKLGNDILGLDPKGFWEATKKSEYDLFSSFLGTIWSTILGHTESFNLDVLKSELDNYGFDLFYNPYISDDYVFCVSKEFSEKNKVTTLQDLEEYIKNL